MKQMYYHFFKALAVALAFFLTIAEAVEPVFVLRVEPALSYREWNGTCPFRQAHLLLASIRRQAHGFLP